MRRVWFQHGLNLDTDTNTDDKNTNDTNTGTNTDKHLKKRKGDTVVGGGARVQSVGLSPAAGARLQSHPQSEVVRKKVYSETRSKA